MKDDRNILIDEIGGGSVYIKKSKKILAAIGVFVVAVGFIVGLVVLINKGTKHQANQNGNTSTDVQKNHPNTSTDVQKNHPKINWFCAHKMNIPWVKNVCSNMKHIKYPCNDFYEYACGGWENRMTIPKGQESWDRFSETTKSINLKIKETFDSGKVIGSAEKKAKQFFDECLKENRQQRYQSLHRIRSYLANIKGSSLTSSTSPSAIKNILTKVHQHGVWPLFKLSVRVNPKDVTKQILTMSPGASPFSGEGLTDSGTEKLSLVVPRNNKLGNAWKKYKEELKAGQISMSALNDEELNTWINDRQKLLDGLDAVNLPLMTPRHNKVWDAWFNNRKELLEGKEDENDFLELHRDYNMLMFKTIWQVSITPQRCDYWDYLCTPKPSEAETLTNEMLLLELDLLDALVKGRNRSVDNYGNKKEYKIITIRELKTKCSEITWETYFRSMMKRPIPDDTEIMLLEEQNIIELCKVISNYTKTDYLSSNFDYEFKDLNYGYKTASNTKTKSLANYLLMSLAKSLMNTFDSYLMFDDFKDKYEQDFNTNHWYRCMIRTNEAFGLATGSIYIRHITNNKENETIENVKQIVSYVKKAYKSKILTADWLDNVTRTKAEEKIDFMLDKIGYPREIRNVTYRDNYYKQFYVDNSGWFDNLVSWKKFAVTKMIDDVWKPFDRTRWSLTPATVNAEHAMIRNDMNLPISLFQLPFYSANRPMVMNFGSLGTIIGHEMTHAFGKAGSIFDKYGRIDDWMTKDTEHMLSIRSKCLIHQYKEFRIQGIYKSNPNKSIDEDIADTGGIRASYYAYQLWKKDTGESLDNGTATWMVSQQLTEEMLFFIALSQNYCEKFTSDGLEKLAKRHSPGPFRVKGSLINTKFFQSAYSCPRFSTYAPSTRCRVW